MADKTGIIFDIQSFPVHDGPETNIIVFLKGCPLRCWWCSYPEGLEVFPQVGYSADKCQGCLSCVNACPVNAIEVVAEPEKSTGYIKINREKCKCVALDCFEACKKGGLTTWGALLTVKRYTNVTFKDWH